MKVFTLSLVLVTISPTKTRAQEAFFNDVTETLGIDFQHEPLSADGAMGYRLPEIMGSGGALFDFDGDGDLDVYLVQATREKPNRLYRQRADHTFEDATESSGLGDRGYGMGVAVGDVDNDGDLDVYVTNDGPDTLYLNAGDGRFVDATEGSGIEGVTWSASSVFCDYDLDGDLDLYVTHYLDYIPDKPCVKRDGSPDFCGPQEFEGVADTLYRNDGGSRFTDVSQSTGVATVSAPGLGVVCIDFDDDGRLDFYVANDGKANQLWIQKEDGSFVDEAYTLGAALNTFGKEEAGMGVGPGDVDNDGDIDLFLTHLRNESNTLYRNDGALGFEDATHRTGLGATAIEATGFGTAVFDYDHDGYLDVAVANGRVAWGSPHSDSAAASDFRPYAEPNLVLQNIEGARFETVISGFEYPVEVSRGLAAGDIDNDGDLDLLVTNTAGPARIFRNDAPKAGRWLIVRAFDPHTSRDVHGAILTLTVGAHNLSRLAHPGYSYLSSGDPRAHFGIPAHGSVGPLTVKWPGGTTETFDVSTVDTHFVARKGEGQ